MYVDVFAVVAELKRDGSVGFFKDGCTEPSSG